MATIMDTSENQIWLFKGDIESQKDVDAIQVECAWSVWDPMFAYYSIVFENDGDAMVFKMKNSKSITSCKRLTQEQWDEFKRDHEAQYGRLRRNGNSAIQDVRNRIAKLRR